MVSFGLLRLLLIVILTTTTVNSVEDNEKTTVSVSAADNYGKCECKDGTEPVFKLDLDANIEPVNENIYVYQEKIEALEESLNERIESGSSTCVCKIEPETIENCLNAKGKVPQNIVHFIELKKYNRERFAVSCNNKEHGGGWLVVLRREDGSIDFNRNWQDYKEGFGNLLGEFFIGLDILHELTENSIQELLITLECFNGTRIYARYDFFSVRSEHEKYKLNGLGKYSGNAGDTLWYHAGHKFSTKDQDNDQWINGNCAQFFMSGWWHVGSPCYRTLLTAKYVTGVFSDNKGITWWNTREPREGFAFVEMMIRPRTLDHYDNEQKDIEQTKIKN